MFFKSNSKYDVTTPVKGSIISLEKIDDPVFSSKVMGDGVAIRHSADKIVAPVSGTVCAVPKTNHAVALTTDYGAEILVHVGINTVELGGKYFHPLVTKGEYVQMGQPLLELQREKIEQEGYTTDVIIVVLNSEQFAVKVTSQSTIMNNQRILVLTKN